LSELQDAAGLDTKLTRPFRPAPRVAVRNTESGQAIEPILDETANLEDFHSAFLDAFGTTEQIIAEALFEQLVNALHADPTKALDAVTANLVLALLYRIGPRDELEAMLACQMIIAHVASIDTARRGLHIEQAAAGRQAYLASMRKLMVLFAAQVDALNRHRGKGITQKFVIERVLVAPGGQAVVGAISSGRGDGRKFDRSTS
jgi:hypothetical protein